MKSLEWELPSFGSTMMGIKKKKITTRFAAMRILAKSFQSVDTSLPQKSSVPLTSWLTSFSCLKKRERQAFSSCPVADPDTTLQRSDPICKFLWCLSYNFEKSLKFLPLLPVSKVMRWGKKINTILLQLWPIPLKSGKENHNTNSKKKKKDWEFPMRLAMRRLWKAGQRP